MSLPDLINWTKKVARRSFQRQVWTLSLLSRCVWVCFFFWFFLKFWNVLSTLTSNSFHKTIENTSRTRLVARKGLRAEPVPLWSTFPCPRAAVQSSMPSFHAKMQSRLRTEVMGADTIVWLAASAAAAKQPSGLFFQGQKLNTSFGELRGLFFFQRCFTPGKLAPSEEHFVSSANWSDRLLVRVPLLVVLSQHKSDNRKPYLLMYRCVYFCATSSLNCI